MLWGWDNVNTTGGQWEAMMAKAVFLDRILISVVADQARDWYNKVRLRMHAAVLWRGDCYFELVSSKDIYKRHTCKSRTACRSSNKINEYHRCLDKALILLGPCSVAQLSLQGRQKIFPFACHSWTHFGLFLISLLSLAFFPHATSSLPPP